MARLICHIIAGLCAALLTAAPMMAEVPRGLGSAAAPLLSERGAASGLVTLSRPLTHAPQARALWRQGQPHHRSLFDHSASRSRLSPHGVDEAGLLTLIATAEAGAEGYDAVQHGARIRPSAPPTSMSLAEIFAWIEATPGQPHAIGRYQFIPPTLERVVRLRDYPANTRFTADVQDDLARVLLEDAGLAQFGDGTLDQETFMHNLARIWAGLPLPDGRSYYHGHAGNRATMTWAEFQAGMARIWPSG